MSEIILSASIETVEEAREAPSRTYRLDLDRGRIVGTFDGIEAVRQAIRKAIITPRFKCLIYDNQYGSEIEETIVAKDADEDYIRATAEGFIRDALLPDSRIIDISDFEFEFVGDSAHIKFTAETIFGQTDIEEEI